MKITIISKYYSPDPAPYSIILQGLAESLSIQNNISVLTTQPSYQNASFIDKVPYNEVVDGIHIERIKQISNTNKSNSKRIFNSLLFSASVFFRLMFGAKPDMMLTVTTPPVIISAIVSLVSKLRSIPFIYHCQDIYPEIALNGGHIKSGFFASLLWYVDRRTMKRAFAIVVLSEDMKTTITERKGIAKSKIRVISNFIHIDHNNNVDESSLRALKDDGLFTVLYCGNFGYLQRLDQLIDAAHLLCERKEIRFIFMGGGVECNKLKARAQSLLGETVDFVDFQPPEVAFRAMRLADIGIISIAPLVHKTAFPTKTIMYMAAGLYSVAIVDGVSNLASFFNKNFCGMSVEPDDIVGLKRCIETAYEKRNDIRSSKQQLVDIGERNFGKKAILEKWDGLIQEVKA